MSDRGEKLWLAQQQVHAAGKTVAEIARDFTDSTHWGDQRMAYLSEALVRLNESYALVRAATCNVEVLPSVYLQDRAPIMVGALHLEHAASHD